MFIKQLDMVEVPQAGPPTWRNRMSINIQPTPAWASGSIFLMIGLSLLHMHLFLLNFSPYSWRASLFCVWHASLRRFAPGSTRSLPPLCCRPHCGLSFCMFHTTTHGFDLHRASHAFLLSRAMAMARPLHLLCIYLPPKHFIGCFVTMHTHRDGHQIRNGTPSFSS